MLTAIAFPCSAFILQFSVNWWEKTMKLLKLAAAASVSLAALAAPAVAKDYIVLANGNGFDADFDAQVIQAGGVVEKVFPFGVAIVSAPDSGLTGNIGGVNAVVEDNGFDVDLPDAQEFISESAGFPPSSGDDDFFFDLQWGHNYVGAQNSWNKGYRGQGVRVAVLDTGFDLDHPDLAPNIDFASSADMTGEGLQYTLPDPFSHGTHTAGTVAAADNGFGTIGVAPEAQLVLVKVLSDAGSGSFADIINGIYYATSQNVQVMSMSLGTVIPRSSKALGSPGLSSAVSALANAVKAAMKYAEQQGVTVVVSAGNAASDLDGDGSAVRFQTGLGSNLGISALGPQNWATYPDQDLAPASYTNFGTSMVDFAAPGGDFIYPGNELCTVAGITRPCWVFDLVFSTGNNSWYWSAGTSMAAPHAAGVAALIISETGDSNPAHVRAEMRKRAVDGGKPGVDDYFGHGIANTGN